jgi:hypothetical protein
MGVSQVRGEAIEYRSLCKGFHAELFYIWFGHLAEPIHLQGETAQLGTNRLTCDQRYRTDHNAGMPMLD